MLYEKSATDVALGSAGWTARADDPSTILSSPAGLTRLKGGNFDLTLMPLFVNAEFNPDPLLTTTNGADGNASGWLPAGGAFYSQQLSDTVTFGVGVGVAAHCGIFNQTAAINNTPIFLPGAPQPDGELKIDTNDWTFQGNLGVLWEGDSQTRIGLQYLSSARLEFSDVPEFTGVRPALEAALRLAGVYDTQIDLGTEMPQAARVGSHIGAGDTWRVMADVGWEEWSKFGKIDVLLATDDSTELTADRNYKDVWHVSLGAAYDTSMVDDQDRTPDLAVGSALRLGIGAKIQYNDGGALIFAYETAWSGDLPMAVSRGPLAGTVAGESHSTPRRPNSTWA